MRGNVRAARRDSAGLVRRRIRAGGSRAAPSARWSSDPGGWSAVSRFAGVAHVVDDRCPHLGSDLALSRVRTPDCAAEFHGWCWGADGRGASMPRQFTAAVPAASTLRATLERWGFRVGRGSAVSRPSRCRRCPRIASRQIVLRPQRVNAHSDVIFPTASTWPTSVHRTASRPAPRRSIPTGGRSRIGLWDAWPGAPASASSVSAGVSWIFVRAVWRRHRSRARRQADRVLIFFTLRPDAALRSRTRTMLFLRRRFDLPRAPRDPVVNGD